MLKIKCVKVVSILYLFFLFFTVAAIGADNAIPNIVVDGNISEWTDNCLVAVNSDNSSLCVYALITNGKLFIMLKGLNFSEAVRNYIYIDKDNNSQTGYKAWAGSGADFYIDKDGWLYKYNGNATEGGWQSIKNVSYAVIGTNLEAAVDLSDLDIDNPSDIRISGYLNINSKKLYTPAVTEPMKKVILFIMPSEGILLENVVNCVSVNINAKITNKFTYSLNTCMLVGLYDNDNQRLIGFKKIDKRLLSGEVYTLNETLTVNSAYRGLGSRVFVWDGVNNIKPLATAVKATIIQN